jgi:methionyl-tRNA formyltransferase
LGDWGKAVDMKSRIILLTDKAFADDLAAILAGADVGFAYTMADLSNILSGDLTRTRLISFGSDVIVPPAILNVLPTAYNFHPGPPEYRGLFPSVYALYDNAREFGVTCHEMTADIDSGAIVAVSRFAIAPILDRAALDALTYQYLLKMLKDLAPALSSLASLPRTNEKWSGPLRRKADFAAMCRLPPDCDETEFQRRVRAVGEGPHHALTIERDGKVIELRNVQRGNVTRAGKPIS